MITVSKIFQTTVYVVAIILILVTIAFATPKSVTATADIGTGVGEYRFELHKIGTPTHFERWADVEVEILVFKKGNSEVLQRLPVDSISIDSPYFDIWDVNGDGYKDLLLYDESLGAGPSSSADVFMYIPKLRQFVRSKTLSGRGNIEASKNKGCVIINYKCSAQAYTDEEWCFNISTGKWKMVKTSNCPEVE
jgi:hypothetical protein